MAKNGKKRRKRQGFTLPVSIVAGLGVPLASVAIHTQNAGIQGGLREASRIFLGWDNQAGQWNWNWMRYGLFPVVIGGMVHKFVGGRLGVNRFLAKSGIPIVRL